MDEPVPRGRPRTRLPPVDALHDTLLVTRRSASRRLTPQPGLPDLAVSPPTPGSCSATRSSAAGSARGAWRRSRRTSTRGSPATGCSGDTCRTGCSTRGAGDALLRGRAVRRVPERGPAAAHPWVGGHGRESAFRRSNSVNPRLPTTSTPASACSPRGRRSTSRTPFDAYGKRVLTAARPEA